jgi:hypothetical protein
MENAKGNLSVSKAVHQVRERGAPANIGHSANF